MHTVYFSLGSNLGYRKRNLRKAIEMIGERVGNVVRQSSLYETEPWGYESEHRFLNAAVCVETELSPREVLAKTQQIEREMGRKEKSAGTGGYADRPIDIDILLYDRLTLDEPDLKIPHPLMYLREFVMKPLGEILQDDIKNEE